MKFSIAAVLSAAIASTYAFSFPQASTELLLPVVLSISIFHVSTVSAFAIPNPRDLRSIMPDSMLKRDSTSATNQDDKAGKDNKDEEDKKKHHHKHKKPSDHPVASITKKDVSPTASHTHTHTRTHDHQATPEPTLISGKNHTETGSHHHEHHHHKTTTGAAGPSASPTI